MSKNAAEFRIENKCKDKVPEILLIFLSMWKQHIMYLNNEENKVLGIITVEDILEELVGEIYDEDDAVEQGGESA